MSHTLFYFIYCARGGEYHEPQRKPGGSGEPGGDGANINSGSRKWTYRDRADEGEPLG